MSTLLVYPSVIDKGTSKPMNGVHDTDDLHLLDCVGLPIAIEFEDHILHVDALGDDGMGILVLGPIPQFKWDILVIDDLLSTQPALRKRVLTVASAF